MLAAWPASVAYRFAGLFKSKAERQTKVLNGLYAYLAVSAAASIFVYIKSIAEAEVLKTGFQQIESILVMLLFCTLFYLLYLSQVQFRSVELKRKPRPDELFVEVMLMFVFLLGVWILQNRIRRAYHQTTIEVAD